MTEQELREQIANDLAEIWHKGDYPDVWQAMATHAFNLFKQTRWQSPESCLKCADDYAKAFPELAKEDGYVRLSKDQSLPLTKMELFLQDNQCLEIKENGDRIRYLKPYYPEPTEKYPLTRLHIKGECVASRLQSELEAQQDMLKANFRKVE
ncbi:MAG: hypothetical protein MUP17_00230 [candidate division Zixibacteria bacterium]|nr:hypothetical protein [candidate division Zixibacteria bacterium]